MNPNDAMSKKRDLSDDTETAKEPKKKKKKKLKETTSA